jgi:L-ascorbate oxidase
VYDSLDVHVVHCLSVLVDADQAPDDYYMVACTRFIHDAKSASIVIRYAGSSGAPPAANMTEPPAGWAWSINQARSFRWNLTASVARPNPQGSYHYGQINITRTIKVMVSRVHIDGKLRYGFNSISHRDTETPPQARRVLQRHRQGVQLQPDGRRAPRCQRATPCHPQCHHSRVASI